MGTEIRTYLKTHPWITFQLNLKDAGHRIWLLLGEAQSKAEHISDVPILPSVSKELFKVYLAKGVLATTAIEGNTLTEEEVRQRLEKKLNLPPSKEYLGQEIDNVIEACNAISNQIFSGDLTELSVTNIEKYNRLILKDLPLAEGVVPGQIRDYSVGIGQYRGAPAEDCKFLLEQLCDWLNNRFPTPEEYKIAFGVLKAIIAHVYIAWIHPFGDGNGRTARLIEFQILLATGVPTTAAHLLSNHYNQTRAEYYRQLDEMHKSKGYVLPFIEYALQGFIDGLRDQIKTILAQQLFVHWKNHIYDTFRNKDNATNIRRRRLALDLSTQTKPVPISEIRLMTPRIAESYANLTDKTIQRDLNYLEKINLLVKTKKGVRVKWEIMRAFRSPTMP